MKFRARTLDEIADMICGNFDTATTKFVYRSSSYLTRFFQDADTDYRHDGSTRAAWVSWALAEIMNGPHENAQTPPAAFAAVIRTLMDRADAKNEGNDRPGALAQLNATLSREGFEAFYAEDGVCYLRHMKTQQVASFVNPHRALSKDELEKKAQLAAYLDKASEDELIEDVLLPMFRQLGFRRITAAGHKDKALEYGKDVWMKFVLPTGHVLYFGIQAKKGKLDAAGMTKNTNVAEVLAQARMMLGHEVFDPDINKKKLVDHAFIIAGGDITKQAKNWLAEQLDLSSRSQILFMDRSELLDVCVTNNVPLPQAALPPKPKSLVPAFDDDIPF